MMAEVVAEAADRRRSADRRRGELVHLLSTAGRVGRRLDAVLIETVGEIETRSSSGDRDDRMTTRFGCHDVSELVERATLCSRSTVVAAAPRIECRAAVRCRSPPASCSSRRSRRCAQAMCEGLVGRRRAGRRRRSAAVRGFADPAGGSARRRRGAGRRGARRGSGCRAAAVRRPAAGAGAGVVDRARSGRRRAAGADDRAQARRSRSARRPTGAFRAGGI